MNSTRCHQRTGVTLLEAIMVVLVLAAGASATLMTFDGEMLNRRQVRTETISLSRLLANARTTAMEGQGVVRVRQQSRNGRQELLVTREASALVPQQVWMTPLAESVRLTGNPQEIQFRPDGTAHTALRWSVSMGRTSGEVVVSPVTGQSQHTVP